MQNRWDGISEEEKPGVVRCLLTYEFGQATEWGLYYDGGGDQRQNWPCLTSARPTAAPLGECMPFGFLILSSVIKGLPGKLFFN